MSLSTLWKPIGGEELQLHSFLISTLHGGEWLTAYNFHKRTLSTHWMKGCVGLESDWMICSKERSLICAGNRTLHHPAQSSNHTNYAILAPSVLSERINNSTTNYNGIQHKEITTYTGCPWRKGSKFGRVFLRSNYNDITQNTYIQSSMVTEILAREVWNFDSYYSLIDYQIHIETGRNMWSL